MINGNVYRSMIVSAANNIANLQDEINKLNVFPVPDGDTGTNMSLTMQAGKNAVDNFNGGLTECADKVASALLRGGRGNSGVILSLFFRGVTKELKGLSEASPADFARAFKGGVESAYKAVRKPTEGTVLTVMRLCADRAAEIADSGITDAEFFAELLANAKDTLAKTPDMLPVLKQAGVVDSGGQGLMQVLKGAYDGYLGKEITFTAEKPAASRTVTGAANDEIDTADIKFGYCTEFIIMTSRAFTHEDEKEFKAFLSSIGDSIVCVADDELVKVHVHTNDPGLAIQKALTYGQLTSMKIDNMREEHQERVIKNAEREAIKQAEEDRKEREQEDKSKWKEYGFISVSAGAGIGEIFKGLGVDYLIEGGQTMNPSTEDMLNAIRQVPARNIFILPNNSNIIMAAKQAKQLTKDKEIFVIPTKTIPQGITAIINFVPDSSMEENAENMTESIKSVKTGQITYAVRDTMIDNIEIHKDDIIGLGDKGMLADGTDINDVAFETVCKMMSEDSELISIYYGQEIDEARAKELCDRLSEEFPSVDVEVNAGNQPVYYYFLSVE